MEIDGEKLFKARISHKPSLDRMELGSFLGVTYSRIQQLEKPGKHRINPHVLSALAKRLGVKQTDLI